MKRLDVHLLCNWKFRHLQLFLSFNIGFRFGGSLFVYRHFDLNEVELRNLFTERNNRETLLLRGDNGKVARGWDAIDGGVVGKLPHHPVLEAGRFEVVAETVAGNPDRVALINSR